MTGELFGLLPAHIRQADDALEGTPLRALLSVIEEQVDVMRADIAQLYENWFVETCAAWIVPYIGDLVGYESLGDDALATIVPRRDVANVIRSRRRKGTLGVLETLARDVTGWPAIAVEFEHAIAATYSTATMPRTRERTLDLRDSATLAALHDARSLAPRTVATSGTYALGGVGIIVSRLRACSVSRGDAASVSTQGDHCYTFDALGFDVPLVSGTRALPTILVPHDLASEYGPHESIALWTRPAGARTRLELVSRERVFAADLRHWRVHAKPGDVAVDVERGRIAFAPGHAPDGVVVRYFYGEPADIGAGEYPRDLAPIATRVPVAHGGREEHRHLRVALEAWRETGVARAAIEFGDSHVYDESGLTIDVPEDGYLEIRAGDGSRPVVRIEDRSAGHLDMVRVRGGPRSTLVLDGLVLARRGLEIAGEIGTVIVRRCTFVPNQAPIVLRSRTASLVIEHSIVGDIRAIEDETRQEPSLVRISDSIVGARGREDAIGSPDAPSAFVDLAVARSTIFGRARVHGISLVENSIFVRELAVRRRERGCVRFSYVAPQSLTPKRFGCVEEPAPVFMSRAFGTPGYARLARACPRTIALGGENRGEMGAFFSSRNAQKAANLEARLAEYVPPDVGLTIHYVGDV
ncbi:MAG: hypothetical protein NVS1B2_22640 [Vulcanimicrobiaceae bacterium]